MAPKISICRKKDHVYLKLMGSFTPTSAAAILQALERVVRASFKFTSPDSQVYFTFRTQTKVNLVKPEAHPHPGRPLPLEVVAAGERLGKQLH